MAIAPVPTISFEAVRAVSLGDLARDGRILEAKVTAMLTGTLARLSIDGQSVDVTTPRPLPPGATMTLRAERDGGQLRLVTQGPIRPAPEGTQLAAPARGAAGMPDMLMDPLRTVLARVQAMAVEAALDQRPAGAAASPSPAAAAFAALADQASASQRATGSEAPPQQAPPASQGTAGEAATPGQRGPAQTSPPQLPAALLAAMGDEALLSQRAGGDTPLQQAIPARLQALALEAALSQRAGVEGVPAQAPAAKLPPGALESLQAMLVESAVTDDLLQQDDGVNLRPQGDARLNPAATALGAPADADIPDPATLANRIAAAAQEAAPEPRSAASALAASLTETVQPQAAAADMAATLARGERPAIQFTFAIPVYFPGNPQPVQLEVTRDGEDTEEGGEGKPRSWTIRFAAEAGPLGMIHAAISQTGDQIGVQLWAERGETAALFKQSARDLQDSLEASNLKLDALKIAEGRPETKAPTAGDAGPGVSREEIL